MAAKSVLKFAPVVIMLLAGACKQDGEAVSDGKSLDNFTAADGAAFTFNSCSGSEPVSVADDRLDGGSAEKAALRSALSAVPKELQAAIFDTLKGRIVVVSDIGSACAVPVGSARDATLSCWKPADDSVTIYIKREKREADTIRNIRHSVVRAAGYILTDVILKVSPSADATLLKENASFATVKKELTAALVSDLNKSKSQIPALYSSDRAAFENGAFAESFDSWYCSSASREKMRKSFPMAHDYFGGVAQTIPEGLSGSNVAAQQPEGSEEGLSLWGRWGAGNGPLRQGLSNWGSFRAEGGGLMNFRRFNSGGGLVFQRPWFNPMRWGGG